MFKYTLDNKRYHTLNYYLKNKFNDKVIKISLMVILLVLTSMVLKAMVAVYIVLKVVQVNMEVILTKI